MTFSLLWAGWIIYFLVVEGVALLDGKKGGTLSEKVWRYVTQPDSRRGAKAAAWWVWPGRIGVAALGGWLVTHFLFGI